MEISDDWVPACYGEYNYALSHCTECHLKKDCEVIEAEHYAQRQPAPAQHEHNWIIDTGGREFSCTICLEKRPGPMASSAPAHNVVAPPYPRPECEDCYRYHRNPLSPCEHRHSTFWIDGLCGFWLRYEPKEGW